MIKVLNESEISGLNNLLPSNWNFDYEALLKDFLNDDFFHAFILIQDERVVGTGNVLLKGKIGWLANIMIDTNYRGRGLGNKMTKFLVDFLETKNCETQLLLATKLGERLYQKIGFRKTTEYQCFESGKDLDHPHSSSIRTLKNSDLDSVLNLDRKANGEYRIHLIKKHYKNGSGYFTDDNTLLGFLLPAFGSGLIISQDAQAGCALLELKHSKKGSRTFLPIENQIGINYLNTSGLNKGESFSRMVLGKENKWNPTYIYSFGSGLSG